MPNSLTQSTRDTSRRNVAPDASAKFGLSRLDADTFASWVPHAPRVVKRGKLRIGGHRLVAASSSSTEQDRAEPR
jgi:hypothetical protein